MTKIIFIGLITSWLAIGIDVSHWDWSPHQPKPCAYAMCEWEIKTIFQYMEQKKQTPWHKRVFTV